MATRKKLGTKQAAVDSADDRRRAAKAMVDGTACSAVTAHYLSGVEGGADAHDLRAYIAEVARAVAAGELSELEKMLLAQSVTLQAMFADLAFKAKAQTGRDNLHVVTSLALKAAAGSRQAITALAELRMPKQVLFAKQANIAQQQQVNNGQVPDDAERPSRAEKPKSTPSGLLEQQHGQWLDPGAQGAAGGADPHLAPVGEVDRTAQR